MESVQLSVVLPGSPEIIFNAWLDASQHAEFTGADARIEPFTEGTFHLAEGYITGRNLLVEPCSRIIQAWRTTDFPPESPASELDLRFEKAGNDTRFTLSQTHIPDGMAEDLKQGWLEYYFEPMKDYFSQINQGPQVP
ncbi:MAG: SRPBCC domain-containing protein [Bacteroidales bacterium]